MALNGIDVSSYQADLNLSNVSYDFVMIKATEGVSYVNPACEAHFQQAKAAGKKRAVYHYADGNDAVAEANWFVENCKGYIRDAIFVLDWEGDGVEYVDWAKKFLERVEALIGYKPAIYMSEYVENSYNWAPVVAEDFGLIMAKYSDYEIDNNYDMSHAGEMPVSVYWPFYFMWQWTSKGHLGGYAGDLDCDIVYLTAEQWDLYAGVPFSVPVAPVVDSIQPPAPQTTPESEPVQPVPAAVSSTPTNPLPTSTNPLPSPQVNPSNDNKSVWEFLRGYKTHIIAVLFGLYNLWHSGGHFTPETIDALIAAAGLSALRSGVENSKK
ncbi:GH25 family lysozyme [Streptomyces sp. NPDC058469]|uniref:GH25 family lysozyme n=1 Tax=Streptomyces sp. NPDC058469 TaxID=3346514 RepID=UPI003665A78E